MPCSVSISTLSAGPADSLFAGPDARLRLQAIVTGGSRPATWKWMVSFGSDPTAAPLPVTLLDSAPGSSTIEFPIQSPGRYTVQVGADAGSICSQGKSIVVSPPQPNLLVFSITPPELWRGTIPTQKIRRTVSGAKPDPVTLPLAEGMSLSLLPATADGTAALPSYIRVVGLSNATVADGYTDRGPMGVLLRFPTETYEVLVVPDADLAPQLFFNPDLLGRRGDQSLVMLPLTAGLPVAGTLTDGRGQAVADARVVMRSGSRPSTLATSLPDGSFHLLTRPGTHSLWVAPPFGSGLPEIHLPADPGLTVSSPDTAVQVDVKWTAASAPPVAATFRIKAPDGLADVPGAWVRLESAQDLTNVATVTMGASPGIKVSAPGAVRLDGTADGSGIVRFPAVPPGGYTLTVLAPDGMSTATAGPSRAGLTISAAGLVQNVALAAPVALVGKLLPLDRSPGMRVIARDLTPGFPAAPVAALVDGAGGYRLVVPASRSYRLEVDPSGREGFARGVLGAVDVGAGAAQQSVAAFTVPSGVVVTGMVLAPLAGELTATQPVDGALVQVFCPSLSPTCPTPEQPLAEIVTRPDGTFRALVPAALTAPAAP